MVTDRHGRAPRADNDRRRRPADGFRLHDGRRFSRLVQEVLPTLPARLIEALADAQVVVDDVPPAGAGDVPLARFDPGSSPPRLTVYRRPLESRALSREELGELVRAAVGREVARALGLADDLGDDWDDPEW